MPFDLMPHVAVLTGLCQQDVHVSQLRAKQWPTAHTSSQEAAL